MGPLIRLDTTLTGDRYTSILSDHLHPFMSIVHSDGLGEFQQDNAIPHTSRNATYWLQEHSSEFRHFRWPPKSPGMNIIEYIRGVLQRAVRKRSPPSLTPTDLWQYFSNFQYWRPNFQS
ncbi:transposable element tcb2 transposase [Trichonephila clavipes]|uniref:Transposable element tcb2 transposase n=1 Tax=Trichonephila clavipes TaxID=2585209 RepID=A0A8X6USP0_TRICX|nr:transposable element tcb2 transposase [Trichonephila clavipes]